jgi:hypothetical protein
MKRTWRTTLAAAITGAALVTCVTAVVAPLPAQAGSTQVSHTVRIDCGRSSEPPEFKTFSTTGNTCWTGVGWAWVGLYRVSTIWSGEHSGWILYSDYSSGSFSPWRNYSTGNRTIIEIVLNS